MSIISRRLLVVNVLKSRGGGESIQNPFFSKNGISYSGEYVGAPMLDANSHVFTYTDNYSDGNSLPIAAFPSPAKRHFGGRAIAIPASPPFEEAASMPFARRARSWI
jgi:hypothetical protein